ncbi:hypothetical protein JCM16303_000141 [Sporobolomyces ruberrimus]
MATKSRTNLFLSYRDSAIRPTFGSSSSTPYLDQYSSYAPDDDSAENARLIQDGGIDDGDWSRRGSAWSTVSSSSASKGKRRANDALPPKWVDLSDQVDALVERVKPKISQLDKLHSKHLLPGFKDRSAEEREIQSVANSITNDLRSCQNCIRKIAEQSKQLLSEVSNPSNGVSAESKRTELLMAANVQTALATKVQTLSTTFRKKQSEYLRLLKGNESRSGSISIGGNADPLASLAEDEQYSRSVLSPNSNSPNTPSLAQQQLFSPTLSQTEISTRSTEINSIAQSIGELSDLFKDLNSLVIDQGTLLDRIDWNVEQMGREVKGAVTELQQATRYQKRSGKCQLIFLLLLLIFGCLVIIAYKPSFAASSSSSATPSTTSGDNAGQGISSLLKSLTSLSLPLMPTAPSLPAMPSMPSLPTLSLDDLTKTLDSWKANLSALSTTISSFQTELTRGSDSLYQRIIAQRKNAEVHPETQWDAEVRLGTDLCVQERAFLRNRREWMRTRFAKLMEVEESEVDVRDLPVVAFAASGGGYRAMLNTIASLSAAEEVGILDCTSYIAGVSGSCWALNVLNSIGGGDLAWTTSHLRERVKEPFLAPETFVKLLDTEDPAARCLLSGAILKEASKGGELSLVDVYGSMVSTRIYVPSEDHPPPPVPLSLQSLKTSYQRRLVDNGQHPLPIYCSIRHDLPPEAEIKKKEKEGKTGEQIVAEGKWSWFETTPHEVGCDQLGAFIPTWALGRVFSNGSSTERLPELSITILSGIFASAFCSTLFSYFKEVRPLLRGLPLFSKIDAFVLDNAHKLDAIHPFPPAELPNFLKGLKGKLREGVNEAVTDLDTLGFMDAGAQLNVPYVPLMRRQCDVVIALDASADSQDIWFSRAAEYAKQYTATDSPSRWPSINIERLFPSEDSPKGKNAKDDKDGQEAKGKVDAAKKQEAELLESGSKERKGVREKNPNPAPLGSSPGSAEDKEGNNGEWDEKKPMPTSAEGDEEPPLSRCSIWLGSTRLSPSDSCRKDSPTVDDLLKTDGIALAYIPMQPDEEFENPLQVFSTWKFDYKEEETKRLERLARANFLAGEKHLKTVIKGVWMRKRQQRLDDEANAREV